MRANLLLGVVGTGQAPTDAKRPVGVISLIGGCGDSIPNKPFNCSEEKSRGKVKEARPRKRHQRAVQGQRQMTCTNEDVTST